MVFLSERAYGSGVFSSSFDDLNVPSFNRLSAVASFLGVTPATVNAWRTGKRTPPRSAVAALWLESRSGRAEASNHAQNGAAIHQAHALSLQRENAALRARIDTLTLELDRAKLAAPGPVAANDFYATRA